MEFLVMCWSFFRVRLHGVWSVHVRSLRVSFSHGAAWNFDVVVSLGACACLCVLLAVSHVLPSDIYPCAAIAECLAGKKGYRRWHHQQRPNNTVKEPQCH